MVRPNAARERGGSKLNLIITLLVLAAIIFAGVKLVPVYFANYQFQDAMQTEARFALSSYPRKSIDDIRDDIFKKAQELSIPTKKESIRVIVDGTSGNVDISVDYVVTVDMAVYQWTHEFHPHADNHTI
ncbi:MAG TPA: hypothetical protein VEJ46_06090 [Candidatus Acidoferrum sp.]|nr:hypothetical protein [Candidatus Acidoferrum sp.]